MIGQTLGHYRILEKAGSGGMGVVYRAYDQHLERDVAVKVLPSGVLTDDPARRRFHKEATALARLNHPNVESVYEFGTQDGIDFIVMEYVAGKTLARRLVDGSLPEKEVIKLGIQVTAALQEAHRRGLVHRDLKPENIAITEKGDAKVLDFGLAKLLHKERDATTETLTQEGAAGTLPYMPPEQLRGEAVDARADIYAVGAVLYEMVTGQRAFGGDLPSRVIDAILHEPPLAPRALNRRISAELERIILKCLEKEPENRFQSAKELEVDLRHLVTAGVTGSARAVRRPLSPWAFVKAGAVLIVAAAIIFGVFGRRIWLSNAHTGIPRIESLAVLPLVNLSGDPSQDYFADGMTEEVITELGQIGVPRVISLTSVMQYRGAKRPKMPQIARELNVDGVVEGSVQRVGDRVRISATLVHAPTDRNVWSRSYEREMENVLAMQDEVARAIAAEVRSNVNSQKPTGPAARRIDPQAYELYLKGRYFWNKRTEEGLKKGLQYFQEAVAKNPREPRSHAGIADSYLMLAEYGAIPAHDGVSKAKAAALKALELDESLAEAHASLAALKEDYDWDWAGAEKEFKRSLELNPSYATSHQWYAEFLAELGHNKEAVDEISRARELDPLSLIVNTVVGKILYESRQNQQAVEQLERALELDPNFGAAHRLLGQAYLQLSKHNEAIAEFQRAIDLSNGSVQNQAFLGQAYGLSGRTNEARAVLDRLKHGHVRGYVSPADLSRVYAGLGQKEQALQLLEEAYKRRLPLMVDLKADPSFDNLRSDPRFQYLLQRIGFPQ